MQTADPILDAQCGSSGRPNEVYGWGRINAYRAVRLSQDYDWDVGWLAASPATGAVAPGEKASISLQLDSAGLTADACYAARLALESNDPYQPAGVSLPVSLCVGEPGKYDFYLPLVAANTSSQ